MSDSSHSHEPEVIDTTGMSEGKVQALELTESSREGLWEYPTFAGALFMGQLPWKLIYPYPRQEGDIGEEGEAFLVRLKKFLADYVDAEAIDRAGEIPESVIQGLRDMGAFGIKIPKKYGGLGFSQQVYSKAAMLLGSHCGSTAALLSAHQSIGVPQPLLKFGTEEQKQEFLPRCAAGEITAFALTEDGVGSDPARMTTTAEPTEDGEDFIINGSKLWCTNGTKAKLLVVMAKTPSKIVRGKERNQVSAFVVEANSPGVTVTHRCHFMGLRALFNAVIEFKNVRVPRKNIIAGEGKGLRVALTTLNTGRLTLPANCVGSTRWCLEIARDWSNRREQWGAKIGQHGAIAEKIADMASSLFALEAMTDLTSILVDRKKTDIRVEAAMCKLWGTELAVKSAYEAMQIVGGRGFETTESLRARGDVAYPIERIYRDIRINTIFEGSSEIMRLFLAREAMDPHLKAAGEAVNTRLPMARRVKAALKAAGFYMGWYPKQWLPIGGPSFGDLDSKLARHMKYVSSTKRKLARRMFHAMLRLGPKLEQEQPLLARFIDVGTELFAISASCTRAQSLIAEGRPSEEVFALVDHFVDGSKERIREAFHGLHHNRDHAGYKLAQMYLSGGASWLSEDTVNPIEVCTTDLPAEKREIA